MFIICERKYGLKIDRYYYTDELTSISHKGDIVMVHGKKRLDPVYYMTAKKRVQNTLQHDLTLGSSEIFQKIHKNYRYEIRRAEKEGIECRIFDCAVRTAELESVIQEFDICYKELFKSKGLAGRFNLFLVNELINIGKITISVASYKGKNLCFHAYIQDKPYTELMYSVSKRYNEGINKNIIGYANKYLHWKDIEFFKGNSYTTYDWGGIGDINNISGIAAFKIAFGGEHAEKVSYIYGCSILGKFALWLKDIYGGRK